MIGKILLTIVFTAVICKLLDFLIGRIFNIIALLKGEDPIF